MGKLQISMLGTSFKVQAQEDDAYLEKLLSFYREIVETVQNSGVTNPIQTSIISGITLVDELYKEKQKTASLLKKMEEDEAQEPETEEIASDLIEKLSKALEQDTCDE